ncbi:MAG: hypothetical protein ACP5FT_01150 [Acidilobus sp.]
MRVLTTSNVKSTIDISSYYVIRWDPSREGEAELKKRLVEAFRKGVKRVAILVRSDSVDYMEKAREVLSEFIAQTIVIWRESEVMRA